MKRDQLIPVCFALSLSAAMALGQQPDEPSRQRQQSPGHQQHHKQQQSMQINEMMPGMMDMHRHHAAMANAWAAGDDGVFVVRSGQLLKYDENLKLVKCVDLPKDGDEASGEQEASHPPDQPAARQGGMQHMRQMMAKMHGRLPVRIEVTDDSVFVSQGHSLLKYGHDLQLAAQAELPAATPMRCRMCEMMMQRMQKGHRRGDGDPDEGPLDM